LLERFEKLITKYNMFQKGDSVVCGISGGSDSVCLLVLLCQLRKKWDIKINAVHINHMIRNNADSDEEFVKKLCGKFECEFYSEKFDIPKISAEKKISSELCGRNIRYSFFEKIASVTGSKAILTAHNKNDNAETFLMHLIRGSASTGLGGIAYVRGNIKRPMLDFTKEEIESYLKSLDVQWVVDETNKEDIYTRNKIRNVIIPVLKEINPSVEDAILRCSAALREDDMLLYEIAEEKNAVKNSGEYVTVDKSVLDSVSPAIGKRIVAKAIKLIGAQLSENTVNAVYALKDKQSGRKFIFPCKREAVLAYDKITMQKKKSENNYEYEISAGEKIFISEAGIYVSLTKEKPQKPYLKICDSIKKFTVRSYIPGDKFEPYGMEGHKKLKDFFNDRKMPQSERNKTPVFVADGVIYAVGMLRSAKQAIPKNENEVLYIKTETKD